MVEDETVIKIEKEEESWTRYIAVSIAIIAFLTALAAFISSELSSQGMEIQGEATRWMIFATNAYSSHWVEGSLRHLANEMSVAWYEIANYTNDEAHLIEAQHWQKIADEKEGRAKERFNLYQEKLDEGVRLRESGNEAILKASQLYVPIILFQSSTTLLVVTQIVKRKVLLIFSWCPVIVGVAYLISVVI